MHEVKRGKCIDSVLYLPISMSSVSVLVIKGTVGYNLIISLSTRSKYFISFRSLVLGPLKCGLQLLHTLCSRAKDADGASYSVNSILSHIGTWAVVLELIVHYFR
jgi:hypothetical protein